MNDTVYIRQQDAQEFLRFLLDGLHEDLNRVKQRPRLEYNEKYEDALSVVEKANLAWNRYHALNDSFIFDLFGGQLQSTVRHLSLCSTDDECIDTMP